MVVFGQPSAATQALHLTRLRPYHRALVRVIGVALIGRLCAQRARVAVDLWRAAQGAGVVEIKMLHGVVRPDAGRELNLELPMFPPATPKHDFRHCCRIGEIRSLKAQLLDVEGRST